MIVDAEDNSKMKARKTGIEFNYFRIFMLLWILILLLGVSDFLRHFYSFLENQEARYRASLPENVTEELMDVFRNHDIEAICALETDKHVINAYETADDLKSYMLTLVETGRISAVPVPEETTDDLQVYYIDSGDLRVARAEYKKRPESGTKDIPVWDLTSLDFYVDPSINISLSAPENVSFFVNGRELVGSTGRTLQDPPSAQRFYDGFTTLPVMADANISGFYLTPEVTAKTADGTDVPVIYDEEGGTYKVDYPTDCEGREEMEKYACEAVSAYANYISGDLGEGTLRQYFTKDNIYLYYMQHAELKWFTRHLKSEIHSAEVQNFIAYNDEAFYCEVLVEQYLTMEWGPREPEVLITDGKFYFVKQDGEWKVAGIEF